MGYNCDFCGKQRSMVYCRSDAACLCLSCDQNVHSANALSKRHTRMLICERCNLQPALVRCADERISLCQNCDWMSHGSSPSASNHKRQTINWYSGCPSAAELSSLWSFVSDVPSLGESESAEMGLMSIAENSTCIWGPLMHTISQNVSGVVDVSGAGEVSKSIGWVGKSSMPESTSPIARPATTALPKFGHPGMKDPTIFADDYLCDALNMDEVDLDLENYEELFGITLNDSEELLENGGIDSLFATKDVSTADSNGQSAVATEVSSGGLVILQPACSNAASADSIMSSKTEPILCLTSRQPHSSLSFSGVTGESSGGDYQDCGVSSLILTGVPPWCPPCPETSLSSANRNNAILRYREKKKSRKFEKRVRYASRKARANVRRRVKGRFVKAGDAYDYDPLSQAKSC